MKLTLHNQLHIPGWMADFLQVTGAAYVKLMDPPEGRESPFPQVKIIGRVYQPHDWCMQHVASGYHGGVQYFRDTYDYYARRPYVHAWEAVNEVDTYADGNLELLNLFTLGWVSQMRAHGLYTVGLSLANGHPPDNKAHLIGQAAQACTYVGLHEYSAPSMRHGESWLCLRYRRTMEEWKQAGYTISRVLITECGIDGNVCGDGDAGWRHYTTQAEYVAQLAWYAAELDKDMYVEAATVFTSSPQGRWATYEVDEQLAIAMTSIARKLT